MPEVPDDPQRLAKLPERTCRYGHGPLAVVNSVWRMEGVDVTEDRQPLPNGLVFLFRLYVCRRCGYTELIDEGD